MFNPKAIHNLFITRQKFIGIYNFVRSTYTSIFSFYEKYVGFSQPFLLTSLCPNQFRSGSSRYSCKSFGNINDVMNKIRPKI